MNLSDHPCTLFVDMLLSKKTSREQEVIEHSDESEFMELVSRGKLKHPPDRFVRLVAVSVLFLQNTKTQMLLKNHFPSVSVHVWIFGI